jgi:hypothetical protein
MEFNSPLSNKSEAELLERIENRQKYMPETVQAAIAELQQRGHLFTDEELKIYNEDIQAKLQNAGLEKRTGGIFNRDYNYNIVEDPDAPLLYSRRAIYLFSLFGGALFGSILLAINSRKIEKAKRGTIWILLFGVVFATLQYILSDYVNLGSAFSVICGITAALSIDYFLWRPFIGTATFYRVRPIWVPLTILILLGGLILWSIIYTNGQQ